MNARMLLIISVIFASGGQVLFKKGMLLLGKQTLEPGLGSLVKTILNIVFSPLIFTGLILYVSSTILWLFALSKTQLNYTYPFTVLTFILVMAASYFVFSEPLPLNRIIGGAVICAGFIIAAIK